MEEDIFYEKRLRNMATMQSLIYEKIPEAVNEVFCLAMINSQMGSSLKNEKDMKFIEPYITEMKSIFEKSLYFGNEFVLSVLKDGYKEPSD